MSSYDLNIDTRQAVEENKSQFGVMPKGSYPMLLESYEIATGKTSGVDYIKAKFQVIDGEFKNRNVWKNYFLFSTNDVARNIAKAEISQVALAVGVEVLKQVDQIVGKPFLGVLDIESNPGYNDKNVLKGAVALVKREQPASTAKQAPRATASTAAPAAQFEDDVPF